MTENTLSQDAITKLKAITHLSNMDDQVEYFFLSLPGHPPFGPVEKNQLKPWLAENQLPTDAKIRGHREQEWAPVYDHPAFQRRKPQLVSSVQLNNSGDIYILRDGKKTGPISQDELTELYNQREVLVTDMVSFDSGESWSKLYDIEEFDRRSLQQENLPDLPAWEIFKNSNDEVSNGLKEVSLEQQNTDAIASLAFIENVKSGKANPVSTEEEWEDAQEDKETSEYIDEAIDYKPKNYSWLYAIVIVLSISGIGVLLTGGPSKTGVRSPASVHKADGQDSKVLQPVKEVETNSRRSKKFVPRTKARSRRPIKSFSSGSKKFKDKLIRRMEDNPLDENSYEDEYKEAADDNYYDDGSEPNELDPIRKTTSKEVINPDKSYFNENEQDQFDAEREPASDENYDQDYPDTEDIKSQFQPNGVPLDQAMEDDLFEQYDE